MEAMQKLQEAMQKRDTSGLHSAIATAEVVEGMDRSLIQSAKTLLVSVAMEQRDVAGLRAAITVAEGEVGADPTIIEVRGAYGHMAEATTTQPPNTQHPTPNTHHPPPNTQHPTPNTQPQAGVSAGSRRRPRAAAPRSSLAGGTSDSCGTPCSCSSLAPPGGEANAVKYLLC